MMLGPCIAVMGDAGAEEEPDTEAPEAGVVGGELTREVRNGCCGGNSSFSMVSMRFAREAWSCSTRYMRDLSELAYASYAASCR